MERLTAEDVFRGDATTIALVEAAVSGDVELVQQLVDAGADPDAAGLDAVTPLAWTVVARSLEGFEALLAVGADPTRPIDGGQTVVHLAAMSIDPGFLHTLIALGTDVDVADPTTGETPLMAAMRSDCEPQVRRLLEAGADPDLADADGDRPLHVAGLIKKPSFVLALLEAGADATVRNDAGHDFKTYLDIRPSRLSVDAQRLFDAVDEWLADHDVDLGARAT